MSVLPMASSRNRAAPLIYTVHGAEAGQALPGSRAAGAPLTLPNAEAFSANGRDDDPNRSV